MATETNLNAPVPPDRRIDDLGEQLDVRWHKPSTRRRRPWPMSVSTSAALWLPPSLRAVESSIPSLCAKASTMVRVDRAVRIENLRASTGTVVQSVDVPTGAGTFLTVRVDATPHGASVTLLAPDGWLPVLTAAVPALFERCRRRVPSLREIKCAASPDAERAHRTEHHL